MTVAIREKKGSASQEMAIVSVCTTLIGATWSIYRSYVFHQSLKTNQRLAGVGSTSLQRFQKKKKKLLFF